MLSSGSPAELEVREIVNDPELHREAQYAAKNLALLATPCGGRAVRHALQRLILVYGAAEAARAPAFWEAYVNALRGLPDDALQAAIDEYVALPTSEFFPKPGPLKALGDKHAEAIRRAAARANTAARTQPERPFEASPEEREAVRSMMADFRAKMAEKAALGPQPPVAPSTQGLTDEKGITSELRRVMAERDGAA